MEEEKCGKRKEVCSNPVNGMRPGGTNWKRHRPTDKMANAQIRQQQRTQRGDWTNKDTEDGRFAALSRNDFAEKKCRFSVVGLLLRAQEETERRVGWFVGRPLSPRHSSIIYSDRPDGVFSAPSSPLLRTRRPRIRPLNFSNPRRSTTQLLPQKNP